MLFYKRVELQEDNAKEFTFDVSPDLLEVRLFARVSPAGPSLICGSYFSLSLSQWIWHDNMQFLQDKNIFEHTYFGSVLTAA